jgi:methylmalonyl-CoA/ethylmalonyl-CoA epimerase
MNMENFRFRELQIRNYGVYNLILVRRLFIFNFFANRKKRTEKNRMIKRGLQLLVEIRDRQISNKKNNKPKIVLLKLLALRAKPGRRYIKMNKIEHIGIAVKDLEASNVLWEKLLGKPPYKMEEVASEGVKTSFFMAGPNKVELLEALDPDSPVAKFIDRKGEGIHHIAFEVEDIRAELKRLNVEGFQVINNEPRIGADNKLVAFLHPRSANGVLIELCQEIKPE